MSDDLLIKKRIRVIKDAFGDISLDRDAVNVAICCVNNKCSTYGKKHKKKLCLRVDNEFYHCWVCGYRGKGLSYFFKKHAPRYSTYADEIFQKRIEKKEAEQERICLPENYRLLATIDSSDDPDLRAVKKYVLQRGVTEKQMWYFRMGAVPSGSLRRRVIIPSFDSNGYINYYTARSIDESTRKYVNPKIKRSEIIFNELNIDWSDPLVLVEGPFDLVKSVQNSTCILGSSLGESHALFREIVKNKTPVVMVLDPDAAEKCQKIAALLHSYDIEVKTLDIEPYSDVGEMELGILSKMLSKAREWTPNDRLRTLISTIRSGSLI
jgi:DNA primase